jgi:exodeoxyribonuclease V alpha subunit
MTVHKAQGSEFEQVLLLLPPTTPGAAPNRALSRELLYTGITRCRRQLTLVADAGALRTAIERRAQRWSGLAERLA